MASTDAEIEQLLVSKNAIPIAQLNPHLADPATRKVYGEVTVTWPYSALTKRFAFLLAEPDFRLRRDKGLVRIQLNGPSAEVVGKWELGSGDTVAVALEGVEWAKDDEPARPPGSRLEWQLKYAGKLVLKATLGETQETKYVNIDAPVPVEPAESIESLISAVETDTSEPALEKAPTPRPPIANEYASPVFMKRSRASYGPLFELFDEELEDDGGRRNKGRKRPRYSVERGRWRYREDSSSPEPDTALETPSVAEQSNSNATSQNTPQKPQMTDGGCQTNDFELPPPPTSSSYNTPFKSWGNAENSPLFAMGMARSVGAHRMDMGVQASPSRPNAPISNEQNVATTQPDMRNTSSIAANYPDLFGTPQKTGHAFGNAESTFAAMQAPTQPIFSQPTHAGTTFGSASSPSVGFRFGQPPPQSTTNAPPFTQSQVPDQPYDDHPYPEAYLAHDEPADVAPTISHDPFSSTEAKSHPYDRPAEFTAQGNQTSSYWTTAAAAADPIQHPGHLDPVDDRCSDASMREETPPGTIPPHVADGTRNRDEMKQEGLLSEPVYRQGVPEEALPDHGDASAGDEDESMDSDEKADYDEEEKGDDYDLRNYDRVSDDEEGYQDEQEPLSDEDLLDDDEERYLDEEGDYDEDDFEEDDYEQLNPYTPVPRSSNQQPPQPKKPSEPVVIDLLSDSDEDEPPVKQPPRPQYQQPPPPTVKSEPVIDTMSRPAEKSQPLADSEPEHDTSEDEESEEEEEEEEAAINGLDGQVEASDVGEESDKDSEVSEESIDVADDVADEQDEGDAGEEDIPVEETQVTVISTSIATAEDRAVSLSPEHTHRSRTSAEGIDTSQRHDAPQKVHIMEEHVVEEQNESVIESFQTQPAEMLASFQTQTTEAAQDSEAGLEDTREDMDEDEMRTDESQVARIQGDENQEENTSDEKMQEKAPEDIVQLNLTQQVDHQAQVKDERQTPGSNGVVATEEPLNDTTMQQPAEGMELDPDNSEANIPDMESASADGETYPDKSLVDSEEQDAAPSTSRTQHDGTLAVTKIDASMTTATTSHVETETSETQQITFDTQETEPILSQPATTQPNIAIVAEEEDTEMADATPTLSGGQADAEGTYGASPSSKKDMEMTDAGVVFEDEHNKEESYEAPSSSNKYEELADVVASSESEAIAEEAKQGPPTSEKDEEETDSRDVEVKGPSSRDSSYKEDNVKDAGRDVNSLTSSPQQTGTQDYQAVQNPEAVPSQIDGTHSDEGEEFHDVSEIPEAETFSPIIPYSYDENSSFMTANSEVSEVAESEANEPASTAKRKRAGRKSRNDLSINFKRSKGPPSSEVSPSSQRTTRSKAMSFQQKLMSPKDNKEDMSIQLARAAMKSPTKRKFSSKSTSRLTTSLVKRLADEMPECVPLKDLKKYNNRALDVAVVATSVLTPPKRTPVREYVSSLTVTDPSLATDSVVEVTIFSLHRDYFPVVKPGDSILLRAFTVKALPDKGWGLKSDKNVSSWAVFEADGGNTPQMRAAPVELNEDEQRYLVDLRGWYATMDDGIKDKLGKAVGELIEKGREQRGQK